MKRILAIVALTTFAVAGCSKKEITPGTIQGVKAEVSIIVDGGQTKTATGTEDGVGNENDINLIEFYTFNADGTQDSDTPYLAKSAQTAVKTTFNVTSGNGKIFAVVINEGIGALAAGDKYDDFKEIVAALELNNTNSQTTPLNADGISGNSGFVMFGEGTTNIVAESSNNLTIAIKRLVSKIPAPTAAASVTVTQVAASAEDVNTLFGTSYDDTTITTDFNDLEWTLDGYVMINGIGQSYVYGYAFADWDSSTFSWYPSAYDANDVLTQVYSGDSSNADYFISLPDADAPTTYVYENTPSENPAVAGELITYVSGQTYSLILKGHFTAEDITNGTLTSNTRYWRVNICADEVWSIYRNCVYKINVTEVKTIGWGTAKQAEEDGPIINPTETAVTITLSIMPWTIHTENVIL